MIRRRALSFLLVAAGLGVSLPSVWAAQQAARIISLSSPLTETLYTLGAQNRLIAVSDVCVYPSQVVADRKSGKVQTIGSFSRPDMAAIDALRPDLILTSTGLQRRIAEQLRAKGYRVLHFEPHSFDDILKGMQEIGSAVGKEKESARLVNTMRQNLGRISSASMRLKPVRVYLEVNHEGPWTTGSKSPLNDLIHAAGGVNIFADREDGIFVTSHEEIVRRNPDIILSPIWTDATVGGLAGIIPLGAIYTRPGYEAITAVKNSRVLYYDSALLKHEGPRQVLALRKLAYLLHPEAFQNPLGTISWELGRILP